MAVRLVHRPARTTRRPGDQQARVIEAPPTLGQGGGGNGLMQALLPVTGVLGSVGMMTVLRNGLFMVMGAALLVVTIGGALAMALSQRGRSGRERRKQRERYLDYLERLREEFAEEERTTRADAGRLDPPVTPWSTASGTRRGCGSGGVPTTTSCRCGAAPGGCRWCRRRSPSRAARWTRRTRS